MQSIFLGKPSRDRSVGGTALHCPARRDPEIAGPIRLAGLGAVGHLLACVVAGTEVPTSGVGVGGFVDRPSWHPSFSSNGGRPTRCSDSGSSGEPHHSGDRVVVTFPEEPESQHRVGRPPFDENEGATRATPQPTNTTRRSSAFGAGHHAGERGQTAPSQPVESGRAILGRDVPGSERQSADRAITGRFARKMLCHPKSRTSAADDGGPGRQ